MSGTTLDDVVIPLFTKGLKTFDHIITKAEEYAKAKGIDANSFLEARLIDDQNPLVFQLQNATKTVKVTLGRLTGVQSAPFEDKENTVEDLHKRLNEALELLKSVKPGAFKAQEEEQIDLPFGGKVLKFSAKNAALSQGVPNFFFHLNTAYSILRSKGVPLGKADYIGSFLGV